MQSDSSDRLSLFFSPSTSRQGKISHGITVEASFLWLCNKHALDTHVLAACWCFQSILLLRPLRTAGSCSNNSALYR